MLGSTEAYHSFAVTDLDTARDFYANTLGLETSDEHGLLMLHLKGNQPTLVYPKDDHRPAVFTVLNFTVDDIDAAVDGLAERGVEFERYEGFNQDDKGIVRGLSEGGGPDIAWFTDPSGNIIAVLRMPPA